MHFTNGLIWLLRVERYLFAWSNIYNHGFERRQPLCLQGGMSNELYNTIARVTDGIYEGTNEHL